MNIIEGLQIEIDRVRSIILEYESLPNDVGRFAISMMNFSIDNAKTKIAIGDTIGIIQAFKDLQQYEL